MRVNLVSLQFQPNLPVYREWLWWHRCLGFDHIYILDNNRTDFDNATSPLPAIYDNVTVIPVHSLGRGRGGAQEVRYQYAPEYTKDADAIIVLDSDEYLYFKQNQSVQEFLAKYEHIHWEQLGIPWKAMASNKAIESGTSVIDDFRHTSSRGIPNNLYNNMREACAVKSFLRMSSLKENDYKDYMHGLGHKVRDRNFFSCNGERITEGFARHFGWGGVRFDKSPAYVCHYRWTYLEDIRKASIRYKASNFYGSYSSNPYLNKDRCVDGIPPDRLARMYETRMSDYISIDPRMWERKQVFLSTEDNCMARKSKKLKDIFGNAIAPETETPVVETPAPEPVKDEAPKPTPKPAPAPKREDDTWED